MNSKQKEFLRIFNAADDFLAGRPSKEYTPANYPVPASPDEAKAARQAVRLSQTKFAAALGLSPSTIRSWEAGRRNPGAVETKVLRGIAAKPDLLGLLVRHGAKAA